MILIDTKDAIKPVHNAFQYELIKNKDKLPQNYQYFGSGNNVENLCLFAKNNPFFASTLISRKSDKGEVTYEIISLSKRGCEHETYFAEAVSTLDAGYYRVNLVFNSDVTKIISYQAFKEGDPVSMSLDECCARLSYLLVFYAQLVHATFHITHYLMVAGLADAITKLDEKHSIKTWGMSYVPNVFAKNEEVDLLLLGEGGILVGLGYRSKRQPVIKLCRKFLEIWGSCTTAKQFLEEFLLKSALGNGMESFKKSGILVQFFKHADLVPGYSKDIMTEFNKINSGKDVAQIESYFQKFFTKCGVNITSKLQTMSTWIEIMSITSIVHGTVFSFSRLVITQPILIYMTQNLKFGADEMNMLSTVTGTLVGIIDERTVFNNEYKGWKDVEEKVRAVQIKYSNISEGYKTEYFKQISQKDSFSEFGWILSDFFPEGIDARQLTMTTYI